MLVLLLILLIKCLSSYTNYKKDRRVLKARIRTRFRLILLYTKYLIIRPV